MVEIQDHCHQLKMRWKGRHWASCYPPVSASVNKVVFSLTSQCLVQWMTGGINKQCGRKGEPGSLSGSPISVLGALASEGGRHTDGRGEARNPRTSGCCLNVSNETKIPPCGICFQFLLFVFDVLSCMLC